MDAYFFDVDGVLSNIRQEVNKQLIERLAKILIKGEPLGLISGRGLDWQLTNVVKPIEYFVATSAEDHTYIVDNLIVSGEFGGVRIIHQDGARVTNVDDSLRLPIELQGKLLDMFKTFNTLVFAETEKQTMLSCAKIPTTSDEEFTARQPEIIQKAQEIVDQYPEFMVHSDRYSVNIKHKKADKRYATGQVIDWLTEKNIHPEHYYAFGDSISDLDIGVELFARKLPMQFVYVGKKEELEGHPIEFPYTVTEKDFDLGTLEFLDK